MQKHFLSNIYFDLLLLNINMNVNMIFKKYKTFSVLIYIGYHMSGEVISVLSLKGRYYNCHERAQRASEGQL